MSTIELLVKRVDALPDSNIKLHLQAWLEEPKEFNDAYDMLGTFMDEAHDGAFTPDETAHPIGESEVEEFLAQLAMYQDMKVSFEYLEYWQQGERPITDPEDAYDIDRRRNQARERIIQLKYPDPLTIGFDNEACPIIQWRDPEFDCETFYEERRNLDDFYS